MPISTVIREKRRELGMTQEQVAERLGVSASAVNKWERGNTCPDIMILLALARLLETDVNTLLCFKEELTDQEIAAACEEVVKEANENGIDAGSDLAEKKIREYPNCMKLMYSLNTTLEGLLILGRAEITEEECRRYEEKIFARYEFILDHAADERTRNSAAYMLVGRYMRQGDCRRAEELLDLLFCRFQHQMDPLPKYGTCRRRKQMEFPFPFSLCSGRDPLLLFRPGIAFGSGRRPASHRFAGDVSRLSLLRLFPARERQEHCPSSGQSDPDAARSSDAVSCHSGTVYLPGLHGEQAQTHLY